VPTLLVPHSFTQSGRLVLSVLDSIDASFARLAHRFRQRARTRVHVALGRRDVGVPGEQLQLVNGNAIVGQP